jgi:hypothetical protein
VEEMRYFQLKAATRAVFRQSGRVEVKKAWKCFFLIARILLVEKNPLLLRVTKFFSLAAKRKSHGRD